MLDHWARLRWADAPLVRGLTSIGHLPRYSEPRILPSYSIQERLWEAYGGKALRQCVAWSACVHKVQQIRSNAQTGRVIRFSFMSRRKGNNPSQLQVRLVLTRTWQPLAPPPELQADRPIAKVNDGDRRSASYGEAPEVSAWPETRSTALLPLCDRRRVSNHSMCCMQDFLQVFIKRILGTGTGQEGSAAGD